MNLTFYIYIIYKKKKVRRTVKKPLCTWDLSLTNSAKETELVAAKDGGFRDFVFEGDSKCIYGRFIMEALHSREENSMDYKQT